MSDVKTAVSGAAIEVASYTVTDKYFGKPYIDRDEPRELAHSAPPHSWRVTGSYGLALLLLAIPVEG